MRATLQGFRRAVDRWRGKRGSRRSLWASRGSEGGPVAVVMASGGDGGVRVCERERRRRDEEDE